MYILQIQRQWRVQVRRMIFSQQFSQRLIQLVCKYRSRKPPLTHISMEKNMINKFQVDKHQSMYHHHILNRPQTSQRIPIFLLCHASFSNLAKIMPLAVIITLIRTPTSAHVRLDSMVSDVNSIFGPVNQILVGMAVDQSQKSNDDNDVFVLQEHALRHQLKHFCVIALLVGGIIVVRL